MTKEYLLKNLEGKTFEESKRFGRFSLIKDSSAKKFAEELVVEDKISTPAYLGFLVGAGL